MASPARLPGLLYAVCFVLLVTGGCVRKDPYVHRASTLEASQPDKAIAEYERVIARSPMKPAAYESRVRLAHLLADLNRARARACARYVAAAELPGVSTDAKVFLARYAASDEERLDDDQRLCDTSSRVDQERASAATSRLREQAQPSAESTRSSVAAGERGLAPGTSGSSAAKGPRGPSSSTKSEGGGNCHWVNGYTRKNGTYVRGHMRCR